MSGVDRAKEIFDQIFSLSPVDREKALDKVCKNDSQLRRQVVSLFFAQVGDNPQTPPTLDVINQAPAYSMASEQPGATIGHYKLLEKIGHGGFGDVYMAQQLEPVRRRVALKIIKLGMDTKQVVARFEAERQALALMDHPNIARVLDGGATASGRPYFVMELVRGDPITNYCDREKLSTHARLELFCQVCNAIQHAHQKGIIHRDIKPHNVLVTVADGTPIVKVIDFGIAKATNTELTEKTLFTEFRQLIGTPQYMSPEQAERSGVDIDTRSDIYSLGVLLYEILTGRTPIAPAALTSASWSDLQRMIVEDVPRRPSLLVTSMDTDARQVAKVRSTEPLRLGALLKGDLDWIVLKALEKDRSRRYATASEFANDIWRFLRNEAVLATPPSTSYRLRKFIRRNSLVIAVCAAIVSVLLLGLISTSVTSIWAIHERDSARRAEKAARVASNLAAENADRARTIAVAAFNPFLDVAKKEEIAQAWLSDIEETRTSGVVSDRELLIQEGQQAIWWYFNTRSPAAGDRIELLYDRFKEQIGPGDPNFFLLVNAMMLSHMQDYDVHQMADLFDELVESARLVTPEDFEDLLPQLAAALHRAGRDEEATNAIDEYLNFRNGSRPKPRNPTNEKIRLRGALRDLSSWGAGHPQQYRQLEELMAKLPEMTAGVENDGNVNENE